MGLYFVLQKKNDWFWETESEIIEDLALVSVSSRD